MSPQRAKIESLNLVHQKTDPPVSKGKTVGLSLLTLQLISWKSHFPAGVLGSGHGLFVYSSKLQRVAREGSKRRLKASLFHQHT